MGLSPMTRLRGVLMLSLTVIVACVVAPRATSARPDSAVALTEISDPGGAPPFDASEYQPYFKRGTATLVIPFMIRRRDGSFSRCEPKTSDGYLYPNTPYVRWALQKWAYLKRTNWFKPSFVTTRPDTRSGFKMPDYLVEPSAAPSAVRSAECDEMHRATFRQLAAGSYIFWGVVDSRIPGSGYETHQSSTYDPITGVVNTQTVEVPMNNSNVVDNYYLFSNIVTLRDGEVAEMHQSSIRAFAYDR